jgi:hypothetical protein
LPFVDPVDPLDWVDPVDPLRGRAGLLALMSSGIAPLAVAGTIYATCMANRTVIRMLNRNSPAR